MMKIITTPLFYVNDKPHIGHLYSMLYADSLIKWQRQNQNNNQVYKFLTGKCIKINTIQKGLMSMARRYLGKLNTVRRIHKFIVIRILTYSGSYCSYTTLNMTFFAEHLIVFDSNILSSSLDDHKQNVQRQWSHLLEKQLIYKSIYKGYYCQNEESFVTKLDQDNSTYNGHSVQWVEEENYFFKSSLFKDYLIDFISQKPSLARNKQELLHELSDLKDLCISRPIQRSSWGIAAPNDPSQIIYVWFDALMGYLTNEPANQYIHVLGKDIVRFHAIHWPAFLKALNVENKLDYIIHHHWIRENVSKLIKI